MTENTMQSTPPPIQYQQPAPPKKERNVLGIVAFVLAVVGFIFACVPGAFILGWIMLPIAFILSIVALVQKGKGKGLAITALILSVVGTIVGVIVFIGTAISAVDDAFSGGDITVTEPADAEEPAGGEESAAAAGTRVNPFPLGTEISQGDWKVKINKVNLNATKKVLAENMFNDEPPAGSVYILVNLTATYVGTDPDGASAFVSVEFVTSGGNTFDTTDTMAVAPNSFDTMETLYEGASTKGNIVIAVPKKHIESGTLAVQPQMIGDSVFYAVK